MKQITLRGVPEEIEKVIKNEARKRGVSLNKAIVSLLEKTVDVRPDVKATKGKYHDLDHLCGQWSGDEGAAAEESLRLQRSIEEELWKKVP